MPEVDAVLTARWALPIPGATVPGTETLAAARIASDGIVVPSGRVCETFSSAEAAVVAPTPARLAVHAAERRASGRRAEAFWTRPNRGVDIAVISLGVKLPVVLPLAQV